MDVADSKSHIAFYKKQLRAREARRDEAKQACQECCDRLGDAINDECAAPLLLVSRADAQR